MFSPHFGGKKCPDKILQENPRQNPPRSTQQESPTHFCRGAGPNLFHNMNLQALTPLTGAKKSGNYQLRLLPLRRSTLIIRSIQLAPDPDTFEKSRDTPPISIAIFWQKYALLLAESTIYTANLYHDTPPICIAILFRKYQGQGLLEHSQTKFGGPGSVRFAVLGVERFERFRFSVPAVPLQKGFCLCFSTVSQERTVPVSVPGRRFRRFRFRFRFREKRFRRFRFPVPVRFLSHPDFNLVTGVRGPSEDPQEWVLLSWRDNCLSCPSSAPALPDVLCALHVDARGTDRPSCRGPSSTR